MNIKRAKQEIKDTIEAYFFKDMYGEYQIPAIRQRPVLLMGPPGIGKTQIMEQIARECRIGLVSYTITHHTRQSAVGLPFIQQKSYDGVSYSVTEYTMSEIIASIYEKMERTGVREGILFIDEINCVSETLAPTMLQFLQCKTFGNQEVPRGWIIVAAGNPPEYNRSVREFDVVTLDRIKWIQVEENYDVWKEYAYQAGIHPAVMAYLELRRENFYRIETTVDGKQFVTARGWEDLSELLKIYERLGKRADREVVHQYIQHWKTAKDFANYLELYEKYKKDYGLERILEKKYSRDTIEKLRYAAFDERFSVVDMLIGKLNELFRNYVETDRYITLLYGYLKEYMGGSSLKAVIMQAAADYDNLRRAEQLDKTADYIYRRTNETLEKYQMVSLKGHLDKSGEVSMVREAFGKETAYREDLIAQTSNALEAAFEFLEETFGDSQEMAVFVAELNTNYYSVYYLKENDCDKYYQYNKKLLFDKQEAEVLAKLDEVETELNIGLKGE